ncbi:hypothetical protein UPYG_G00301430 [Umbra pygmaea]|uniref:Ig-like domain-containing protein n=1 Tax=Umbra pygmaea TaxID=75934 RepID=A0ABD0WAV5_UMBPY
MADSRVHNQIKLITTDEPVIGVVGDDVILPRHISPETSAVTMTIRWFKETECIYLYKNGQVTEKKSKEGRLSLITQELERGNVSLRMKNIKESDGGVYICQVINGEQEEEAAVWLQPREGPDYLQDETQEDKLQREKSADELDSKIENKALRALSHPAVNAKMEEKDREMENMKKTLRETEEKMKKKDSTLEEKNKELMEKDSTLEEMRKELMDTESKLEKTMKQLNENIKHLQEKETQVDDLTQQVREKERSLTTLSKRWEKVTDN